MAEIERNFTAIHLGFDLVQFLGWHWLVFLGLWDEFWVVVNGRISVEISSEFGVVKRKKKRTRIGERQYTDLQNRMQVKTREGLGATLRL